jgi:GT2 family glycosyltransferase
MTDVSIIIVSYNSASHLPGLLNSIKSSKDKLTKEVILVDNASSDDSLKIAKSHPLKPIVIDSKTNQGFSKAVNQALNRCIGQYVFLLNPDTRLIGDGLNKLHTFASTHQPIGAVVPRLMDINGKPQASVFRFPNITNAIRKDFLGCKTCFGKYLPSSKVQTVDVAVMAAFFMPRSTLETVGTLDERFFLYYEDVEFCRRLKSAKLPIYYLPSAKVKHAHGASGNFKEHLHSPLLASSKIYYGKNYSRLLNAVLWLGHKWQVILRGRRFRD